MGFYCCGCANLFRETERLEEELKNERIRHAKTLDLLMSGERLREKIRLEAILSGAYKFTTNVTKKDEA